MKFSTHNNRKIKITGTCFQGEIISSFQKLVDAFGQPLKSDFICYKSDAEWWVKFTDGKVATIYNWKDGKNYLGKDGMKTEEIMNWHIGGRDKAIVERIISILEKTK